MRSKQIIVRIQNCKALQRDVTLSKIILVVFRLKEKPGNQKICLVHKEIKRLKKIGCS
jgi:hypothetical protein